MAVQYTLEVEHEGLGRNHVVSGPDQATVKGQANALARTWQHEFQLERIQNILRPALNAKHAIDWEKLKRNDKYLEPKPAELVYVEYPREPKRTDTRYQLTPGNTEIIVKVVEEQKARAAHELYLRDYAAWAEAVKQVEFENQRRYAESMAAIEQWNDGLVKHRRTLAEHNDAVSKRKTGYESLLPEAVEDYFRRILSASQLPENFCRQFDLQYVPEAKILIIEHSLPAPEELPRVKEVKYLKARSEFAEVPLSDTGFNRIYSDVLYQICLRTLYELFDADTANALSAVAFSGWVKAAGGTNGAGSKICVISVPAEKEKFQALNLWDTDAKACFKALKGAGNPRFNALMSVKPALRVNR